MVLYHLDHKGTLSEGQRIVPGRCHRLYPDVPLSHFGEGILAYPESSPRVMTVAESFSQGNTYNLEIRAESLRREVFKSFPSRLGSFYCVQTIADLFPWAEYFPLSADSRICEIEYEGPILEFDARFLRGNALGFPSAEPGSKEWTEQLMIVNESLLNYWTRQRSASPLPEILVSLPVTIRRVASLGSYPDFRRFHPFPGQSH